MISQRYKTILGTVKSFLEECRERGLETIGDKKNQFVSRQNAGVV